MTAPRIIGYTHNPSAAGGYAHAVTVFGVGSPPVLSCGIYGHAMDHVALHQEPQRDVCAMCAEIVRAEILQIAVERFGADRKFSDAEASAFVRQMARIAPAVLPK